MNSLDFAMGDVLPPSQDRGGALGVCLTLASAADAGCELCGVCCHLYGRVKQCGPSGSENIWISWVQLEHSELDSASCHTQVPMSMQSEGRKGEKFLFLLIPNFPV